MSEWTQRVLQRLELKNLRGEGFLRSKSHSPAERGESRGQGMTDPPPGNAGIGERGTHRFRQTQRVLLRLGLTTLDEKLSKVMGPV